MCLSLLLLRLLWLLGFLFVRVIGPLLPFVSRVAGASASGGRSAEEEEGEGEQGRSTSPSGSALSRLRSWFGVR